MIFELNGGGTSLNFSVVGGTTQPAGAENKIWVNTSETITSWVFSAGEPSSPTAGMVWFKTATSSSVLFNALTDNTLMTYPTACKQYVSGAWVSKTAKTYQSGAWVDWFTFIYQYSTDGLTGFTNNVYQTYSYVTFTDNTDSVLVYNTAGGLDHWVWWTVPLDFTGKSILRITSEYVSGCAPTYMTKAGIVSSTTSESYVTSIDLSSSTSFTDNNIDVSALSSGYLAFHLNPTDKFAVKDIIMQ